MHADPAATPGATRRVWRKYVHGFTLYPVALLLQITRTLRIPTQPKEHSRLSQKRPLLLLALWTHPRGQSLPRSNQQQVGEVWAVLT